MSWWNTSNITSLASKALKNAQKKIDEALDISEHEQAAEASSSEASKKEKKDFWTSWSLGDPDAKSPASPKSSWSFPWGGGTEENEEVREKTAEEIKSEVLRAAKERTKAKSKLFPTVSKKEEEHTGITGDDIRHDLQSDTKGMAYAKPDSYTLPSANLSEIPDTFGSSDSMKNSKDEVEENPPLSAKDKEKSDDRETEKVCSEQAFTESVAKLDVSECHTVTTSLSGSFLSSSGDIQVNEPVVTASFDTMKESSFQELTIDTGDQFENISGEFQNLNKVSSGNDLLQIGEPKSENLLDTSENQTSVSGDSEPNPDKEMFSDLKQTDEENVSEVSEETQDKELNCDVSSSVEIITANEIPIEENDKTEQNMTLTMESVDVHEEGPTNTHETFVAKEVGKASQRNMFPVTESEMEVFEVHDSINTEESQGDSFDVASKESEKQEDEFQESVSSFVDFGDSEIAGRSESESSINTLDVSQDTCTSEETVIEEGSVSSATSESIKGKLSKDIFDLPNTDTDTAAQHIESEEGRTSSDSLDKVARDEIVDTEKEKLADNCVEKESQSIISEETSTNDLQKVDSDFTADVGIEETGSDGSDPGAKGDLSPANSFVKCSMEDVMEESKGDDNSDNHSGTEKSEGSRSIYSGHESADEIDTTTSSDIEIISLPTPNGDNRQVSPLDPIPLRIALQKTSWRGSPTHRRSDSSGSSANSRDGHTELSPGRDHVEYAEYSRSCYSEHKTQEHYEDNGRSRQSELPALDEEDDNPYHPQRLLKDSSNLEEAHDVSHDNGTMSHDLTADYKQKLAEMAEVLQAREDKLLQLSKENCDLVEANSILRNQLKQSEEAREAEMTDLNELTAEFTQRLTEAEKRVSAAVKEKDHYKKQLQGAQSELAKKAADTSLHKLLEEKEEQIQGLLQEGEKLSKSQLQSNTIIKKLRAKEKDSESTVASQKKKLESQKEELEHLKRVLDSKEETEKKQTEALTQLQAAVSKQEIEMSRLKSDYDDSHEKIRGLQAALDNSYKELAELHRSSAVQDSKAQEAALSAEMSVREELKLTIEKQQQQHKWEKDSLLMQIEDLRMAMARMEKECNRREDMLKQEIADLQKQLQEDEARTQELTQSVSSATRPLLRQIENLQSTYAAQSSTWEKVEKNLADRLADTQNQLAVSIEKERTASDQVLDLGSKVTSLETQNSRLRQEKSQLTAQLEMLKTKVELSEETKQNEAAQIELLKSQLNQEITDLKKQKVFLETQLEVEKSKLEQEKKKVGLLQEQIRDLEREASRSRSRGTPSRGTPSPVSISRQESFASSFHEQGFTAITQEELDRSFYLQSGSGSKQSLYEALRQSGAANLLENLQSQLKLREGEITHLQGEIHTLERTRESMAKELVNLSNSNDDLLEQVQELPVLRDQYKELDQRYNALLQMYGEKVEEADELRLDLQDVKEMYKAQINHLLSSH